MTDSPIEAPDPSNVAPKRARSKTDSSSKRKRAPKKSIGKTATDIVEGIYFWERVVGAVVLLLIYATVGSWGQFAFFDIMGYYDMFAVALMQGQLHLTLTPAQVNLLDMIPYEGKYHFNWGPFPVIFHIIPLWIGLDLSDRVATILASWLCAIVYLEIVLELRDRYFPELFKPFCRWIYFAFALGTPTALLAYRGTVNNEVLSIATLGYLLGFYFFLKYQKSAGTLWALLSGAAVACALMTRITVALHAIGLFLGIAATLWFAKAGARRALIHLAAFSLPIVLGGLLMMTFNQARFGSPMDFGNRYKPEHTPGYPAFSIARVPESFRHYALAWPRFQSDFPWIEHTGWPPVRNVRRAEAASSFFVASPFILMAFLTWPMLFKRYEIADPLRLAAGVAWFNGLLLFLVLLTFGAVSRRYLQDCLPMFMVLCAMGMGIQEKSHRIWRKWWAPAWVVLILSAILHVQLAFYQSFRTPTSDINALQLLVSVAPRLRVISPGPELDREAAEAGHDLALLYIQQHRYNAAVVELRRAASILPDNPTIRDSLRRAEQLAGLQ